MYLKLLHFFYLFVIIYANENIKQRENSKYLKDVESCTIDGKNEESTCSESCSAATNRKAESTKIKDDLKNSKAHNFDEMAFIEGGTFEMGSNDRRFRKDGELPIRNVTVKSFYLDKFAVSNEKFAKFIENTAYITDAEHFENSFVFDQLLPENERDVHPELRALKAQWWVKLDGVTWDHPEGPKSNITDRMSHPVVHVSWRDATKFCRFYNKRLPTEEEWERACRGGLRQKLYPWGNDLNAQGIHRTNIWHGVFPKQNSAEDGYIGTCPVDTFPPNNYGLYNMVGNVWEWTSTIALKHATTERIKKGGSFMCHHSYCYRYRCAARSYNTDDSTASNLGFRCAKDVVED